MEPENPDKPLFEITGRLRQDEQVEIDLEPDGTFELGVASMGLTLLLSADQLIQLGQQIAERIPLVSA